MQQDIEAEIKARLAGLVLGGGDLEELQAMLTPSDSESSEESAEAVAAQVAASVAASRPPPLKTDDQEYLDACYRVMERRAKDKTDPRKFINDQYEERCKFAARLSALDDREVARRIRWGTDVQVLPLLREAGEKRNKTLAAVLDGTHEALPKGSHAVRLMPKLGPGTIGARYTDQMRANLAWRYQADWRRAKNLEMQCCVSYARALQSVLLERENPGDGTINRALMLCLTSSAYADPKFDWTRHVRAPAPASGRATPPRGAAPPRAPVSKPSPSPVPVQRNRGMVTLEVPVSVLCTQLGVPVNASDAEIEDAFQNADLSLTVNGAAHQVSASSIKQKTPRRIVEDEDEEQQPLVVTEVWEVPDDEEDDAQWQSFTHDLKGSKSKQKTPRRKAKRPGKGKEVEEVQEVEEAAAAKKAEEVEESKGGDEAAAATAPLDILNPQVLETAAKLTAAQLEEAIDEYASRLVAIAPGEGRERNAAIMQRLHKIRVRGVQVVTAVAVHQLRGCVPCLEDAVSWLLQSDSWSYASVLQHVWKLISEVLSVGGISDDECKQMMDILTKAYFDPRELSASYFFLLAHAAELTATSKRTLLDMANAVVDACTSPHVADEAD